MIDDPGQTRGVTSRAVMWWHQSLRAIAALNLAVWVLAALAVTRAPADAYAYAQLALSGAYVAGCAFRSFLPVIDIPRLVLIDSRLSSVFIGRSVATIAELAFAAQWGLMLFHYGTLAGSALVQGISLAIVPLILLAEVFSWYAVLTTQQRAHAAENSLWGLAALLAVAGMFVIGPHQLSSLYLPMIVGGLAYAAFIFVYDVPMYLTRWRSDQARGHQYLSVAEGLAGVRTRWALCYRWEDWRNEVPWMTLYFTFGVWSSVWLVYAALTLRPV
jgi:hypothetical protein